MKWYQKLLVKYVIGYIEKLKGVNEMIAKFVALLDGKKMYLAALAWAIKGILEYIADKDISKLINNLVEAWLIAAGKSAISKITIQGGK